jgi:hypothetical protein
MDRGHSPFSLPGMPMSAAKISDEYTDPISATPRLLLIMGAAAAIVTLLIVGFVIVGEWWLLPVTVGAVVVGTGLVLAAFFYTLDEGDTRDALAAEPVPTTTEPEPLAAPAPVFTPAPARRRRGAPEPARRHPVRR